MVMGEAVMDHLARVLGMDSQVLREKNLYKEDEETHFGQKLERWNVPKAWEEIKVVGDVEKRKKEIEVFNKENKWRKRGLSVIPTKFGINFTAKFMNQVRGEERKGTSLQQ